MNFATSIVLSGAGAPMRAVTEYHERRCAARTPACEKPSHANVTVVIDEGSECGARVARRLRDEIVVWLTTVIPAGAPLPRPVGFLWDGGEVVSIYSQPGARVRNIAANPNVTLNFDGDGRGPRLARESTLRRSSGQA